MAPTSPFEALVREVLARLPASTVLQLDLVRELEVAVVKCRAELESCVVPVVVVERRPAVGETFPRDAPPLPPPPFSHPAIPMAVAPSGDLQLGLAARVVIKSPQGDDAARAADDAIARPAAADGDGDAARDTSHTTDGDEVLPGGLGADGDTQAAAGGSARAPTARRRTAVSDDDRKRRRLVAQQARRVRQRELAAAAETTRAQGGPLTYEQQRALDVRERERLRDRARDWSGGRAKRRRTTTATDENEECDALAVAAAVICTTATNENEEGVELADAAAAIVRLADQPSANRTEK